LAVIGCSNISWQIANDRGWSNPEPPLGESDRGKRAALIEEVALSAFLINS
jgi:hypothetical protein